MPEYIKREAVMQEIDDCRFEARGDEIKRAANSGMELVRFAVERIPTADVAPVVHAHWEHVTRWIGDQGERRGTCSRCMSRTHLPPEGFENFCPVCGARMDEKE